MTILHLYSIPLFIFTLFIFGNPFVSYKDMKYVLENQYLIVPVHFILTGDQSSSMIITRIRLNSTFVQTKNGYWLHDP
ncbi:unnamed protein product [Rotaria sp. Silwood2]|nr:unnamed protein product [Rotaria sp. Silwood2]CAF2968966.1 unnamed protein product [Rotaria sp. Silwood2]